MFGHKKNTKYSVNHDDNGQKMLKKIKKKKKNSIVHDDIQKNSSIKVKKFKNDALMKCVVQEQDASNDNNSKTQRKIFYHDSKIFEEKSKKAKKFKNKETLIKCDVQEQDASDDDNCKTQKKIVDRDSKKFEKKIKKANKFKNKESVVKCNVQDASSHKTDNSKREKNIVENFSKKFEKNSKKLKNKTNVVGRNNVILKPKKQVDMDSELEEHMDVAEQEEDDVSIQANCLGGSKKQKKRLMKKKKVASKLCENLVDKNLLPEDSGGTFSGQSLNKKKRKFSVTEDEQNTSSQSDCDITPEKIKKSKVNKDEGKKDDENKGLKTRKSEIIDPERNSRTIFVGNLPHSITKEKLSKLFSKFGTVESAWIRGGVKAEDGKIPKEVTIKKKLLKETDPALIGFVVFSTKQEGKKSLEFNGFVYEGHHLRVNFAYDDNLTGPSSKDKSVFVGHLSYHVKDDELWEMFKNCGEINSVRIIRESDTGLCKGFGYVNFKSADAVELALELNEQPLNDKGKQIRVQRNVVPKKKLWKKVRMERKNTKKNEPSSAEGAERRIKEKKKFRGKSADASNKKKRKQSNKDDFKKKILAGKLTAKTGKD